MAGAEEMSAGRAIVSVTDGNKQARREGGGLHRAPPSLRNIKYTRMRCFKEKNFLKILPGGAPPAPARLFPRVSLWLSAFLVAERMWLNSTVYIVSNSLSEHVTSAPSPVVVVVVVVVARPPDPRASAGPQPKTQWRDRRGECLRTLQPHRLDGAVRSTS